MDILIVYGSLEGQTEKIAERIAGILRLQCHQCIPLSSEHLRDDFQVRQFDAAIVGGSVQLGKFPSALTAFVTTHRDWLNETPSAFFTVCMGIHSKLPKSRQHAVQYGEHFLDQTGWHPELTETFAGAVKYTQYGFITRYIMKMISKHEGSSTDTTHDHEYTDWTKVVRFAEAFMSTVLKEEAVD